MSATGSGKAILFGEHFVLRGLRGVAAPITDGARASARPDAIASLLARAPDGRTLFDTRHDPGGAPARALASLLGALGPLPTLRIEVDLRLPPGAGLGSSAALAAAAARAALPFLKADPAPGALLRAVDASESILHGEASGIDAAAASARGPLSFRRGPPAQIEPLSLSSALSFAIGVASPGRPTAEMVAHAARRRAERPALSAALDEAYASIALGAPAAIERAEVGEIGDLMNTNHALLSALGVGHPALDRERAAALEAGALGAKMTGAGGGGALLALAADPEHADEIVALWMERGTSPAFRLTLWPYGDAS